MKRNILVFVGKPTLVQAAAGYLIYKEEDIKKVIVIPVNSELQTRPECRYFIIGKISSYKENQRAEVITFLDSNPAMEKINPNHAIFMNVKDYILTQAQKAGSEAVLSLSFMINYLQKIVFNNTSEYSLLKSYYTLYNTEYDPNRAVMEIFNEFDKILKIAKNMFIAKTEFEKNPKNGIFRIGNYAVAINYGSENTYLYRYLFDVVDLIIYAQEAEGKVGLLCNKRIGLDETEKILQKFLNKFKSYKVEKQEINAYIKTEPQNVDNIVGKIIKFLDSGNEK